MGQIKHPKSGESLTPQMEGGRPHVRGTQSKDYDQIDKMNQEAAGPASGQREEDVPTDTAVQGGRRSTDANPGIGSSSGTTGSGENPLSDTDRGPGIERGDR